MELTTLYKQYRAAKLAADQAAKEEDKLKKALKKAMEEAGVKNYTDEDGFLFERIVQNRKSMDEKGVLESLKEKGLTQCIKTVEAVDEAIVIAQSPEEKVADVLVGKNVSKKYAVSSLYSTLKAMAL